MKQIVNNDVGKDSPISQQNTSYPILWLSLLQEFSYPQNSFTRNVLTNLFDFDLKKIKVRQNFFFLLLCQQQINNIYFNAHADKNKINITALRSWNDSDG